MSHGSDNPFGHDPQDAAPPYGGVPPLSASPQEGDSTGGMIPYKNMPALLAYYLGLFSMFPCVGLFLAIPAVVLGIMGLRKRAENPAVKGSVHAWIGIVMGSIFTLVWAAAWIIGIIGMVAG